MKKIFFGIMLLNVTVASAESFRDHFYQNLDQKKYSQEDLNKLIYFSDETLSNAPEASTGIEFFSRLKETQSKLKPFDFYKKGLQQANVKKIDVVKKGRSTIVVVPGVFGEMIETRAFEEVFRNPSPAREIFKEKSAGVTDASFLLVESKNQQLPLKELLSVGNLYNQQNEIIADVVLFNTKLMSLESLGDIREISKIFTRRLRKYFAAVGASENIIFVGYSRGTVVGLDMLANAEKNQEDLYWIRSTKAFVSLGGVTYGSDLADVAFEQPNSALGKQLSAVEEMISSLKETVDIPELILSDMDSVKRRVNARAENVRRIHGNNVAYGKFVLALAQSDGKSVDALLGDLKSRQGVDLQSVLKFGLKLLGNSFAVSNPNQFVKEYNPNIRRLKKLLNEALIAVKQLSTQERLKWWAENTIPEHVHYYAIAGTMVNPDSDNQEEKDLSGNAVSYNPTLADYAQLVGGYRDFSNKTGLTVNDSQVAAYKVKFWPEAAQLLNPAQKPYKATFLGLLGVHHWGMALEVATQMRSKDVDPYPRESLLRAIVNTINAD
jgi:hypothetical protein